MTGHSPAVAGSEPARAPRWRIERHAELPSTIDHCRALADAGEPAGAVVVAAAQSAGRGQAGRTWHSPAGAGLWVSVLLRPAIPASEVAILATMAGLAACEALRELDIPCRVKLPNDLVAVRDGAWRKLGGVLVDTAVQGACLRHALVSAGINVTAPPGGYPADIRDIAASCADFGQHAPSLPAVESAFLRHLASLEAALARPQGHAAIRGAHARHVRAVVPGDPALPGEN